VNTEVVARPDRVEGLVSEDQSEVGKTVGEREAELLDGPVGVRLSKGSLGGGQLRLRLATAD